MFYQLGIINVVASGIIPISIGKWRGNKRPSRSTAAFWARNTFTFRERRQMSPQAQGELMDKEKGNK